MKRILCLTLALLLLCGCGGKELDSVWLQANSYTASTYNAGSQNNLSLKSNGDFVVGVHYTGEQTGNLYRLALQDGQVSTTCLCDFHGLTSFNLLGVDDSNGIFVTVTDSQGTVCILRLDEQGRETLRLDLPEAMDYGVHSFTWDDTFYYFLVDYWSDAPERSFDSYLVVYDRQGLQSAGTALSHLLASTAGFLPQEAEWMEELEGRDEDHLLSQLFPEGPQDSTGLLLLPDGTPGMLICRKSPIDGERYGIICAMDETRSIIPVCYYPIASLDGWPLTTFFESRDQEYVLLVNTEEGLMGLHPDGSTAPLFAWQTIGFSPQNLTASQPGPADCTCTGPDGTLWIRSWNAAMDSFDLCVLTPNT